MRGTTYTLLQCNSAYLISSCTRKLALATAIRTIDCRRNLFTPVTNKLAVVTQVLRHQRNTIMVVHYMCKWWNVVIRCIARIYASKASGGYSEAWYEYLAGIISLTGTIAQLHRALIALQPLRAFRVVKCLVQFVNLSNDGEFVIQEKGYAPNWYWFVFYWFLQVNRNSWLVVINSFCSREYYITF